MYYRFLRLYVRIRMQVVFLDFAIVTLGLLL